MKKQYWLKGGTIGAIYFIVTSFIGYGGQAPACNIFTVLLNPWSLLLVDTPFLLSFWRDDLASNSCLSDFFMLGIIFIPINFILGAIVGIIYGKVKNRRK